MLSRFRPLILIFVALLVVVASAPRVARACATMALTADESHVPQLSLEQVLIVWDGASGTEDFIREARFSGADNAFAFVVPTPTRPELSKVEVPFAALRDAYPFDPPPPPPEPPEQGGPYGRVGDSGLIRLPEIAIGTHQQAVSPVVVVSQQRVGSFTAFVLAASDPGALAHWLNENRFRTTPAARAWLAHYVELGFTFSALRYDPPAKASASMTSETVRFRFKSPVPYYPYMEPARRGPAPETGRALDLWLLSTDDLRPVVENTVPTELWAAGWVQPFGEGVVRAITAEEARAKLSRSCLLREARRSCSRRSATSRTRARGWATFSSCRRSLSPSTSRRSRRGVRFFPSSTGHCPWAGPCPTAAPRPRTTLLSTRVKVWATHKAIQTRSWPWALRRLSPSPRSSRSSAYDGAGRRSPRSRPVRPSPWLSLVRVHPSRLQPSRRVPPWPRPKLRRRSLRVLTQATLRARAALI
jgi:hypothetical protein